ncbi:MAG: tRNA uridine-5-carboxymethylaminomethyl(34) synthesis GTPase MnmE, partial [Silicimonas sp.]|nr:tRNA uridine-5-carboxymethylaminomethyl(34) synthesis GTPase MnmE [Silicimonas sp.]
MDTIFALASARGKAGVSLVRISGPKALVCLDEFDVRRPRPRVATHCTLRVGEEVLDRAVAIVFEAPASFTGENVVELHLHGSVATVAAVTKKLSSLDGFRQADAGEFTRRALENEKLDLTQVEGLADLIDAETEAQRRQAVQILSGVLGAKTERWRFNLVRAAALIEATIDFADEDVPVDVVPEVKELLVKTLASIDKELTGVRAAERIRDGFEVAIVGRPNVGKSTLLNALAGRDAAITSDVAGTTRDVIEVRMDLDGLPVTLLDTAGMRVTGDKVETLGFERATQRARASDLCVILVESRNETPPIELRCDDILLVAKSDLVDGDISGLTGDGVEELVARVSQKLAHRVRSAGTAVRERHRSALAASRLPLAAALDRLGRASQGPELVAEELRKAIAALDSLVGRVDVEHLLDEV